MPDAVFPTLLGHQKVALDLLERDDINVVGQQGTRGSGKSQTIDAFCAQQMLIYPGNRGVVFRRKQDDASGEDYAHFMDKTPQALVVSHGNVGQNKVVRMRPINWDGSEAQLSTLAFSGVISDGKQNPDNAKGEFGFVVFPELSEIEEQVFLQALTSCRKPMTGCKVLCAWNPVHDQHWIWRHFGKSTTLDDLGYWVCRNEEHRGQPCYAMLVDADHVGAEKRCVYAGQYKGYATILSSTRDNPHLPADYVERQFGQRPASWVAKWIEGRTAYDPDGHGVFEHDFRADLHIAPNTIEPVTAMVLRAYDPGLYPAILWAQLVRVDGVTQLRILMELTGFECKFSDFLLEAAKMQNERFGHDWKAYLNCGDPSLRNTDARTMQSYLKVMEQAGIHPVRINDSPVQNSRTWRIETVRQWLTIPGSGVPKVLTDPSCSVLIEGFEGGYKRKWNQTVQKMVEEPIKDPVFSGVHDCTQYILSNFATIEGGTRPQAGEHRVRNMAQPSQASKLTRRTVVMRG